MLQRRRPGCLIIIVLALWFAAPATALDVKLWPLIDVHRDASGHRSVHLLGPLFSYAADAEGSELVLRPLFSFTSETRLARRQLAV